ncbi:MAG: hypothetical protein ACOYN2_04875 [Patescibacteria group bacterium]
MFICTNCNHSQPKWSGKCPNCESWNTFEERAESAKRP